MMTLCGIYQRKKTKFLLKWDILMTTFDYISISLGSISVKKYSQRYGQHD